MNRKRRGQFRVKWHMLEKESQIVRTVLNDVLIVRAEALYHDACIEYTAFAAAFREANGEEVPKYEPILDVQPYGLVLKGWKEIPDWDTKEEPSQLVADA